MVSKAVFFKDYDSKTELKIMVHDSKISVRVNEYETFELTPDIAREAARILNIYAVLAEAAESETIKEDK